MTTPPHTPPPAGLQACPDTVEGDRAQPGTPLRAVERPRTRAIRRRFEPENLPSFQAPDFYARCGYETYGVEVDYPPGHTNHLMRKDL